jgi:hypothetical protein
LARRNRCHLGPLVECPEFRHNEKPSRSRRKRSSDESRDQRISHNYRKHKARRLSAPAPS